MRGVFADIVGQELAVAVLESALAHGSSHAYFFHGPPGVGKTETALAFAAALACMDGGCGACNTCRRVQQGIHPDVMILAPEGPEIRIEQIRDVNEHVAYRPYEARAKVYVILESETMTAAAANALLRTLEEPPPHVHFLLVSDSPQEMLPTIVSRCQPVPFVRTPLPVLAGHLRERYGLEEATAKLFARVAQGNLAYARDLARSEEVRERRKALLEQAEKLPQAGLWDTEQMLEEALVHMERRAEMTTAALEDKKKERLEWAGDARTRAWVTKTYDQRVRRARRRAINQDLAELTAVFASWYRDLAVLCVGAEGAVLNQDHLPRLREYVQPDGLHLYLQALGAVRLAQERLRYNVDVSLALGDMFRAIKEALNQWPMS